MRLPVIAALVLALVAGASAPVRAARPVRAPKSNVVLVPGVMVGDIAVKALRWRLERSGHRVVKSGIHLNVGSVLEKIERVKAAALRAHATGGGAPVQIAGHSLGGGIAAVAADELLIEHPEIFEGLGDRPHVVALGGSLNVAERLKGGASKLTNWIAPRLFRDFAAGEAKLTTMADRHAIRLTAGYAVHDRFVYRSGATLAWAKNVAIRTGGHLRLALKGKDLARMVDEDVGTPATP